ncbi:MAG: hypothetical protein CL677_01070 [Bdellovibrionaceae bacterium]|nr:hypothetical protein [Pseudobdellovibrionaceae bacterium]|tara:strand:- start:70302 stop:72860 length:2559 start_codon:yes stop_codon:yes gene_type:complete
MSSNPVFTKLLRDRSSLNQELYKRSDSLSELLPYDEYNKEHGVHVLKDGSLGVCFRVSLIEHEPMRPKDIVEAVNGLTNWLRIPQNCVLQLLFDQSMVSPLDHKWSEITKEFSSGHKVSKVLIDEKVNLFKGMCHLGNETVPLVRSGILSLRYFPSKKAIRGYTQASKNSSEILFSELGDFTLELTAFRSLIKQIVERSPIPIEVMNGAELVDVLRRTLNPIQYYTREFASYNPNRSLSDQVLYNSPLPSYRGLEREGVKSRTLTIKTPPEYAIASGFANLLTLPFPLRMSVNVSIPSQGKVARYLELKDFFLQNTPSQAAKLQKADLDKVQRRIAQNENVVNATISIHIEGSTDEILEDRIRRVTSFLQRDLDCDTILEEEIGLGMYLSSLPLFYTPDIDKSAERYIPLLEKEAVSLLPVFDSFRGTKNPVQLFLSRENNLIPFSLFENETSNHTSIVADTGSGKSSFVIDVLQSTKKLESNPLIFILDKKSSYRTVGKFFDADITVFDGKGKMPFSPFRGTFDDTKVKFLANLLLTGISLTSKGFILASEHLTALTKALKLAFVRKQKEAGATYLDGALKLSSSDKNVEITMNDLIASLSSLGADDELEGIAKYVDELLLKLKPFYGDGVYANFFEYDEDSIQSSDSGFYIYDLDALDSDATLQTLMSMAIIEEIRQKISLEENRKRGGLVVIEELGRLGSNKIVEQFVVDFAETARKLNTAIIGIAPNPETFFSSAAGKAVWRQSDNFVFLRMGRGNVEYLLKNTKFIDETSGEIIGSLKIKKGQHSEIYYSNKSGTIKGAFKNIQSIGDKWLASVNPVDEMKVDDFVETKKGAKDKALRELSKVDPIG